MPVKSECDAHFCLSKGFTSRYSATLRCSEMLCSAKTRVLSGWS